MFACLVFAVGGAVIHGLAQTYTVSAIFGGVFLLSFVHVFNRWKHERHAMKKYLIAKGLPEDDLFKDVVYNYWHDRYGYLKNQIVIYEMIMKPREKS